MTLPRPLSTSALGASLLRNTIHCRGQTHVSGSGVTRGSEALARRLPSARSAPAMRVCHSPGRRGGPRRPLSTFSRCLCVPLLSWSLRF